MVEHSKSRHRKSIAAAAIRSSLRNGAALRAAPRGTGDVVGDTAQREKIYGSVPPLPPRVKLRLTVEQRRALIPEIMRLKAQRLTMPQIARHMGLPTSPVERAWREWLKEGRNQDGNL